jgi:hypothetical protein
MAKPIPGDLKQADNKCYEVNHDKKETSTNLCKNYKDPTHVGICRYDCEGNEAGCAGGSDNCKIIVQTQDQHNLEVSIKENTSDKNQPKPNATVVKFTNRDDGSVIKGTLGSGSDWMKKLKNEKGKACNCGEEPKNADGSDGLAGPVNQQQQPTSGNDSSYVGDRPEDWDWAQQQSQPSQQSLKPGDKVPTLSGEIPQDKLNELKNTNSQFNNYFNDKARTDKPTWEDWNDYNNYQKWLNSDKFFSLPGQSSFYHLMGWDTFGEYKKNKSIYSAYIK